ncbi:MAG: MFS transporter, partial [Rhodobacterales bacterium]
MTPRATSSGRVEDSTPTPSAEAAEPAAKAEQAPPAPPPFPHSVPRAAGYVAAGVLIGLTQALASGVIIGNLQFVAGEIGATQLHASLLVAAFYAPRASLSLFLIKLRTQFGLRPFAECSVAIFALASLIGLATQDLRSALLVQFLAGVASAPLTSLGFLYVLEGLAPKYKMNVGLCLVLTVMMSGTTLGRLIGPLLSDIGVDHAFAVLSLGLALICVALVMRFPLTSQPRVKVISWVDVVSYSMLAIGFGGIAVVSVSGVGYWWLEHDWLGWTLAASIGCLAIMVAIELNRDSPLLDLRWITSPPVLHFTGVV